MLKTSCITRNNRWLYPDTSGWCLTLTGWGGWTRTAWRSRSSRTTSKISHHTLISPTFPQPPSNMLTWDIFCLFSSVRWVILGPRWIKRPSRDIGPQRGQGKDRSRGHHIWIRFYKNDIKQHRLCSTLESLQVYTTYRYINRTRHRMSHTANKEISK